MKFGIWLNAQNSPAKPLNKTVEEAIEQTRAARAAGFDMVCAGQHYLTTPYQMAAMFPLLARVSAEAGNMQVASAIILLPLHNPVYVAETVATMDAICNGRFVLGIGLGYRDEEFNAFGIPKTEMVPRMIEGLEVIKRLWNREEIEFNGKFYKLPLVTPTTLPIQKPHPPIWVAADNDLAVQRAARLGYPWLINPHAAMPNIYRQMQIYNDTISAAGLTPPKDRPFMRELYIAKTIKNAHKLSHTYLAGKYESYAKWGQDKVLPGNESFEIPYEELARDRFLIGDPQYIIERLTQYQTDLGINYSIFRMQWADMPHAQVMNEIELMGKYVIPALHD